MAQFDLYQARTPSPVVLPWLTLTGAGSGRRAIRTVVIHNGTTGTQRAEVAIYDGSIRITIARVTLLPGTISVERSSTPPYVIEDGWEIQARVGIGLPSIGALHVTASVGAHED